MIILFHKYIYFEIEYPIHFDFSKKHFLYEWKGLTIT